MNFPTPNFPVLVLLVSVVVIFVFQKMMN